MDPVICALLDQPAVWEYVFPLNVILIGLFLLGIWMQLLFSKRGRKWFLFPLVCLALALSCEYIYYVTGTFEAFAVAIFGMMMYLAFFGSVIAILTYLIWTKVRRL